MDMDSLVEQIAETAWDAVKAAYERQDLDEAEGRIVRLKEQVREALTAAAAQPLGSS